jgi:ubiquinone/menaquinone biosynthesis C-methylase UbiE
MKVMDCGRVAAAFYVALTAACVHQSRNEMNRIATSLELRNGMTVADVGAGDGTYSVGLANKVGPSGTVYATELGTSSIARLQTRTARQRNVVVVEATEHASGLPTDCCDAILLRGVYHHLTRPGETLASLRNALHPGGRLLIVDFPPSFWLKPWKPKGVERQGHGVTAETVTAESTAAGFERERYIEDWPTGWFVDQYGLVLRRVDHGQ